MIWKIQLVALGHDLCVVWHYLATGEFFHLRKQISTSISVDVGVRDVLGALR